MALVYKDRVKQTVDAPSGSAAFDFDSNGVTPTGYQSFVDALADTNTCIYAAEDASGNWEVGVGTWAEADKTLTRTTILASSNSGSAESFSGTVTVYITNSAKAEELSAVFGLSEVSVTTTANATIGNMHVCSGTSADYTVTLPAASGNAGRLIGFRMASGLTKLITIDGNSSETIDGATTRIMWAGETAVLLCDGSNWFKIAGKTIPMTCCLQRSATTGDQSFSATTWTACATTEFVFGTTLMEDAANDRVKIVRPNKYLCVGAGYIGASALALCYGNIGKNQAANTQVLANWFADTSTGAGSVSTVYDCAIDDWLVLSAYVSASSNIRFESDAPTVLSVTELPQW